MRAGREMCSYTSTHPYIIWAWKLIKHKKNITSPSFYCILWTGLDSDRLQDLSQKLLDRNVRLLTEPNLCFRQLVQWSVFVILLNVMCSDVRWNEAVWNLNVVKPHERVVKCRWVKIKWEKWSVDKCSEVEWSVVRWGFKWEKVKCRQVYWSEV